LQYLDFVFNIHHIYKEQKILFSIMKLEGHDLTWWEIHRETLRLEGDPQVTRWDNFKTSSSPNSTLVCKGLMDMMVLLQEEARAECIGVHHQVQKYYHHVGYFSQDQICTPQVSRWFK
jgi:hypothetical protein